MTDKLGGRRAQARPIAPEKPLATDCCDTGCEVCVFDAYADALALYEKALTDWLLVKESAGGGH